jgi:hypothetical protein
LYHASDFVPTFYMHLIGAWVSARVFLDVLDGEQDSSPLIRLDFDTCEVLIHIYEHEDYCLLGCDRL